MKKKSEIVKQQFVKPKQIVIISSDKNAAARDLAHFCFGNKISVLSAVSSLAYFSGGAPDAVVMFYDECCHGTLPFVCWLSFITELRKRGEKISFVVVVNENDKSTARLLKASGADNIVYVDKHRSGLSARAGFRQTQFFKDMNELIHIH